MKLVQLKCPGCGANLEFKNNVDAVKCEFCGLTTIIDSEKKVIEHKIKYSNYEELVENAFLCLNKLKKYEKAKKLFLHLSDIKPGDVKVLEGLIKAETKNFTELSVDENGEPIVDLCLIRDTFEDYCALVEKNNNFKKQYEEYCDTLLVKKIAAYSQKSVPKSKTLPVIKIFAGIVCVMLMIQIIWYIAQCVKKDEVMELTTSELLEEYYRYVDTIECSYFSEGIVDIQFDDNIFITKDKIYEITREGMFSNNQQCREIASLGEKKSIVGELRQLDYVYQPNETVTVLTENGYKCNMNLECEIDYWASDIIPYLDKTYKKGEYFWAFKQNSKRISWTKGGTLYVNNSDSLYYYDEVRPGCYGDSFKFHKVDVQLEDDEKILHIGKNVTTNKGFYYVKQYVINEEECSKYVDVPCITGYKLFKLNRLSRVYDDLYFAGRYIVAKDGRIYYGYSYK